MECEGSFDVCSGDDLVSCNFDVSVGYVYFGDDMAPCSFDLPVGYVYFGDRNMNTSNRRCKC